MIVKRLFKLHDGLTFINPTGGKVRVDAGGDGHHGTPRGSRKHDGLDFECVPGQEILMPVEGRIVRVSRPYYDDLQWSGVYIYNPRIEIKLWYFSGGEYHTGKFFGAGGVIGHAQDISQKPGYENVTPHIHLRIVKIDPLLLFPIPLNDMEYEED